MDYKWLLGALLAWQFIAVIGGLAGFISLAFARKDRESLYAQLEECTEKGQCPLHEHRWHLFSEKAGWRFMKGNPSGLGVAVGFGVRMYLGLLYPPELFNS